MEKIEKAEFHSAKLAFISPILLVQVILIMLRLHGLYTSHWGIVFIPLWFLDLCGALMLLVWFNSYSIDRTKIKEWHLSTLVTYLACGIAFKIMLSMELSSPK